MTDRTAHPATVPAVLVAIGILAAGALVGKGIEHFRTGDRQVTVRGLSERVVQADLAVLALRVASGSNSLPEAQAKVDGDVGIVRRFLAEEGYPASQVDVGTLRVVDQYAREYQPEHVNARYQVSQTVRVRTPDVARVQATASHLNTLVRQGVVLQDYNGPSYVFTKLNDVRPAMIGEATASARSGAAQFARDSHSRLGGIASATQGSFEINGRDQGEEEGSQVFKRIRVVTTISYLLR